MMGTIFLFEANDSQSQFCVSLYKWLCYTKNGDKYVKVLF